MLSRLNLHLLTGMQKTCYKELSEPMGSGAVANTFWSLAKKNREPVDRSAVCMGMNVTGYCPRPAHR